MGSGVDDGRIVRFGCNNMTTVLISPRAAITCTRCFGSREQRLLSTSLLTLITLINHAVCSWLDCARSKACKRSWRHPFNRELAPQSPLWEVDPSRSRLLGLHAAILLLVILERHSKRQAVVKRGQSQDSSKRLRYSPTSCRFSCIRTPPLTPELDFATKELFESLECQGAP